MRGTTLLALALCLTGCGRSHLTKEQERVFADQVAPELRRVLTNASIAVAPFQLVNTHPLIDGTLWDARMDTFSFTLESRVSTVRLISMTTTPEIQEAVGRLFDHTYLVQQMQFMNQMDHPGADADQIRQLAKVLGYQHGAVVLSRMVGIPLEWTNSSHGPPLTLNVGSVGLYSASTNLDSVDLVVLVHRGAIKAILQRPL
jgi:hypothetical protein